MSEPDAWTTVRVAMPDVATEHEALIAATDRVETLAAWLAERDDIGGVEVRDPSCIADGPEFVAVERPELIAYTIPDARAAVIAAARELAEQLGMRVTIDAEDHVGDDWRDAWKRHYRPLRFAAGDVTLMIRPSWIAREADDPPLELILDPGRAFGTGLHESTRLCLRALVEHAARSDRAPARAIDLGCGSGILGLAAARLWPSLLEPGALLLADHDPEAVETARENVEINFGADSTIELATVVLEGGSTPPEQAARGAIRHAASLGLFAEGGVAETCSTPGTAAFRLLALDENSGARRRVGLHHGLLASRGLVDLVLANIRPKVLIPGASAITSLVAPGGIVVLSGILEEEGDAVREAYPELELVERLRDADWCALVLRRSEA